MDAKKPKVCKFKENCPKFMAKQDCGFAHILCNFNETCRDKQKCMFYHIQKAQFDKPKSQTICRFDGTCSRPNCQFKHEKGTLQQNQGNASIPNKPPQSGFDRGICRFGAKCMRQDCAFKHPERQAGMRQEPMMNNQSMPQARVQRNVEPQRPLFNGQSYVQPQQKRLENLFCLDFLLSNKCQKGANCPIPHEFTQKGSLKRVFFTTEIPNKNFNINFYEHQKQGEQNSEIVYVMQQDNTISFRKHISSETLYKDFGGIGPNQQNKTYLRSITDQMFKAESKINGIEAFSFQQNEYLVFVAGSKISIYNTTKGEITQIKLSNQTSQLTGCIMISQTATLLLGLNTQMLKLEFNSSIQVFQEKPFTDPYTFRGLKFLKITDAELLGQRIIYGINSESNKLVLMNKNLKATTIDFDNATLNDVEVCIINNKIPVALVSVTSGMRQHQVIGVNLLNFEKQPIMNYEFTSGIGKVFALEGHLMVQIKNKGCLVYKLNEFEKQIGIIPFFNEIQQVRKDNKGNLLILESSSIESKGSISIFKVRRI